MGRCFTRSVSNVAYRSAFASPKISEALARVSCLVCLCALSSLMLDRNCENYSYDSRARAWRKNSLPSTLPPKPPGEPVTDGDVSVDE